MQGIQGLHFTRIIFEITIRYTNGGIKQTVACMYLEFWRKVRHTFFHLNEKYY